MGVLFSKSPRGGRRGAGYRRRPNPLLNSLEYGSSFGVPDVGGAGFDGRVDRGNVDLLWVLEPGKFEKLLRSDP